MWRRNLWEVDSTAGFPFGKRVGLTSLFLASLKGELIFTSCDMSGVITLANCNHFAGWRVLECLFALSVKNKQTKKEWVQLVEAATQRLTHQVCNDYLRPGWSVLRRVFMLEVGWELGDCFSIR